MNWFVRVVAYHPYTALLVIGVLSSTCLIIPFVTKELPDFQDPQQGFEARGNEIGQRLTALTNLEEESRGSGSLTLNPREVQLAKELEKERKIVVTAPEEESGDSHRNETFEDDSSEEVEISDLGARNPTHYSPDFFCGTPNADYGHLVFATALNSDLLSLHAVHEMCRFQEYLTAKPEFKNICESDSNEKCCPVWSIPNYLIMLFNRSSCLDVTMNDIYGLVELLETCAPHYYNLELSLNNEVESVPKECTEHNAAYVILHYLVDVNFLPNKKKSGDLKSTMVFLPIARSSFSIPFYESINTQDLKLRAINLAAVDFGIKNLLFDKYLVDDLWLVAASSVFVLVCIWVYTHSFFITLMTIVAIIFSLAIAYFVYTFVLGLKFFPFMNVLAAVVVIGIGSDDSFILCKVWQTFKRDKPNQSIILLSENILRHSALALFVTTVTTCAAFFSSFIADITSIKCFSIFACISVAANFILMLTWMPACIVIVERWSQSGTARSPFAGLSVFNIKLSHFTAASYLVNFVIKFKFFWILLYGSVGVTSIVVVFYHPKLNLPDTEELQLFKTDHLFEQYDLVYRDKFWFERSTRGESQDNPFMTMPLIFVWGVLPLDTGDYLDPLARGKLHFDPSFDMSDTESQAWLLRFCRQLRNQTFYQPTYGLQLSNCFIESFIDWMKQRCVDPVDKSSRSPCCESEHFPYSRRVFSICIKKAVESLYRTPQEFFTSDIAGPKFSKKGKNHVKAVVIEYQSNVASSTSFIQMHQFYQEAESWTKNIMSEAPPGMQNGWFISNLHFYNLQSTLAEDTVLSVAVSMTVAFIVLLGVTLNIILSFLAILTVTFIITVTVAILVLLGWQLNVLESVAMNVAIGLAVDFSLHYAINYRLCPSKKCRITCVAYSVSMMGGPTIMAALTTGAAGFFMLPSDVLAYRQIGIFLIDVMAVSWLYSTFFLMPILCVIGPENDFGQFSYPNIKAWLKSTFGSCDRNHQSLGLRSPPYRNVGPDGSQNFSCETLELDTLNFSESNKTRISVCV